MNCLQSLARFHTHDGAEYVHSLDARHCGRRRGRVATFNDALALAAMGYAVFPCRADKRPATPHGFKDAAGDPAAVRDLWFRYPGALIGIATGTVSDLAVLDIDAKHGGADWWKAHKDRLPITRVIRTRSGGLHLWFRHGPGLRCSASAIAPGIDVRADGGYVIAWHTAGFPVLRDSPLAPWPEWLRPLQWKPIPRGTEPSRVPDDRQITALVRFVAAAPEAQRNNRLFWAACRMAGMVASRLLSESEAEAILVIAARQVGLPESEARRTAKSGLAAGGRA
jgi:hypothetical protein